MTTEQYRRWQNFALRMAHRGWPRLPRKSRRFVADCIRQFFWQLNQSDKWDRRSGNPGVISRIRSWDHTDNSGMPKDRYGHEFCGDYVCDMVTEWDESWNPYYWAQDARTKRWDDRWGTRIRCCLRAGLDMACEPSMGVVGFTAGDLRRMYRGAVPAWISDGWQTGGFFSGNRGVPIAFAEIPDTDGVLL